MSTKQDNTDDDSFIIVLGTSPGASMDVEKDNSIENGSLDKSQIEDAMKDMSIEANMAFKAQFKLGDSPSAASMMVASTIVTDDRSTEELQKRFGDLLDENVVLKETLKQNNESMKEQFLLIASCQEDMLRTHKLHKDKFEETKELVERLRQENRKLKLDVVRMAESELPSGGVGMAARSGASSGVEFVTSPDDDVIDKLTAQLELVEKQRRQVIVENEKLTWQKESLEHIVDVTTKERDDLKQKLNNLELQLSTKENLHAQEINKMQYMIKEVQNKLKTNENAPVEEIEKRNATIALLEGKVAALQNDLKTAQIKILDLENIKLEFTQHKSGVSDTVKMYKEQIQELNNRLKEAQKTVFQPVRFSVISEPGTPTAEYTQYASNVKLYDRTLKHLADFLNGLSNGLSDSLVQTLAVVSSLYDFKLERASVERVRSGLGDVKQQLEKQHSLALSNVGQVRALLSIFEGIFKDFNELLKKMVSKQDNPPVVNVEALTAALVARGQEIQALQTDLSAAMGVKEDTDLLKAQVDLYKSDFEAEREARQKMASEKEHLATDLRTAQRRVQELVVQLEEVRKLSPGVHRTVTAKRPSPSAPAGAAASSAPPSPPSPGGFVPPPAAGASASPVTTGNMVYTCPKCLRFSSDQMKAMDDHFDFCLDDFMLLR